MEAESMWFNGLENVKGEGKGDSFSLGNRQRVKAIIGILEKGVVVGMAWQPSKDILRSVDFIL